MGTKTKPGKPFHGLDFATRTAAAWIGAWLPLWLLFDALEVEVPVTLLLVTFAMAVAIKASAYISKRAKMAARILLALAIVIAAGILLETTIEGFRICSDALSDAINRYYGTELSLYEAETSGSAGVFLFLLAPAYVLLLLSDLASDERSWIPWLAVSFLFPWTAILVDVFCPLLFLCMYAGLVVYFMVTAESHTLRVSAGARYRAVSAAGIAVMLLIAGALISQKFYDERLSESKVRTGIGNYLSEHFPVLFGRNNAREGKGDSSGLSDGKLPTSGRLQYSNRVIGNVTLPKDFGTLYLRTGVYGEYTGKAWVPIEDYMDAVGADSEEFLYASKLPVSIEQLCMSKAFDTEGKTGLSVNRLRFPLQCATVEVELLLDLTIAPLPYYSLLPDSDGTARTPEGSAVFSEPGKHNYTVRCYYNKLQLPGLAAYSKDLMNLSDAGITLSESDAALMESYRKYVYDTYLTIPESCRKASRLLADEPCDSVFESILQVQNFLSYNYAYTTRPGELPKGKDFIDYFLTDNKKGYCTYFASAAVMLFRAKGIPARYCEGFAVEGGIVAETPVSKTGTVMIRDRSGSVLDNPEDFVTIELTDQYAHAWVEVFLDGYGWYPVEVTNSLAAMHMEQSLRAAENVPLLTVTPTPTPTKAPVTPKVTPGGKNTPTPKAAVTPGGNTTPTVVPGGPQRPNGDTESNASANAAKHLRTLLRVLLVLTLTAAPFVLIGLRYRHHLRIRRKKELQSNRNASLNAVCRETGRVLRLRGLSYIRGETDTSYLARAGEAFGHADDLRWLCEAGNRAAYSDEQIDRDDRGRALDICRALRKEALAECSLPKRLYLKYIRII